MIIDTNDGPELELRPIEYASPTMTKEAQCYCVRPFYLLTLRGCGVTRTDMWISTQWTYLPGQRIAQTPELPETLAELIDRVTSGDAAPDMTIVLDGRAAHHLQLPTSDAGLPSDDEVHPAQAGLRAAGWGCSTLRPWTTIWRGEQRVIVGLADLIDAESAPMMACPSPLDVIDAMATWRSHTGHGWAGSSIMASHALMRGTIRTGHRKSEPIWLPKEAPSDVDPELTYERDTWRGKRPADTDRWLHSYDMNLAYLSAAGIARITPWALKPTGKGTPYSPERAGWWLIQPEPWTVRRIMSPLGHLPGEDLRTAQTWAPRWVTGPTLALLDELTEAGTYGGYEILDSWTATGAGPHLRHWATPIRDLLYHLADTDTAAEPWRPALIEAAKQTYKRGLGALVSEGGRIHRPDWTHAVIAMDRANTWRRAWRIGTTDGRWPRWANTDALAYTSPHEDPFKAAPGSLKTDPDGEAPMRLGYAKPEGAWAINRDKQQQEVDAA